MLRCIGALSIHMATGRGGGSIRGVNLIQASVTPRAADE